jgi:hypothetical protein
MSSTRFSTKPCLDEQRSDASKGWDDTGLVEAAFEGRLARRDGLYVSHARMPALDAAPAATQAVGSGSIPVHVPGTASQVPVARLVETRQPGDPRSDQLRVRMIRALSFLAVVLGTLLLADLLS